MKTSIVACVALGACATCTCAQEQEAGNDPGSADTAPVAPSAFHYQGDAPGGHQIAVFSAEPGRTANIIPGAGVLSTPALRRGLYPYDDLGPGSGIGSFTLGRQYNLEYLTQPDVGDLHHAGTAGTASNFIYPGSSGAGGTVRYFGGRDTRLSTGGSWTVSRIGGDPVADRAWGLSLGVDYGAFSLRAAHQNRHVAQVHLYDLAGQNMEARNSIVAANLRMGWGTAYAAYSTNRGWGSSPLYNPDNPYGAGVASTSSTDSRDTLVGLAVPLTRSTTFLASFIRKNDRDPANRDANQFAVGASHVVSRKTDFYAAFSHTVNTNGTGILINGAGHPSGSSAINVGMRHAF